MPERKSALSRSVFDGSVPVLAHAPPSSFCISTSATRLPKYAACAAPFSPAGPLPMTTRSYLSCWFWLMLGSWSRIQDEVAQARRVAPRLGVRVTRRAAFGTARRRIHVPGRVAVVVGAVGGV